MRKKFLVILLFLSSLLAACSSGSSPSQSELEALRLAQQYCNQDETDNRITTNYKLLVRATKLDPSYREYAEAAAALYWGGTDQNLMAGWQAKITVFCETLE